jgi:FkbM family methyltransferase
MIVDQRSYLMLIKRCLELASPANVVIEIGAFNGDDTKRLHQMARKPVRQFAFEPDPRNLLRIRDAKIPVGVTVMPCAVGGQNGRATLHLSSGWECSSSLRAPKEHIEQFPHIGFDQTCEVDVVTLDAFCADRNIGCIDFMWVDAQGAERDIVVGGEKVLKNSSFMYLERSDHELYEGQWKTQDMIDGLAAVGWKLEALFENDALFYNGNKFAASPLKHAGR